MKPGEEELYFPSEKPPNIGVFLFGDDNDQIVDVSVTRIDGPLTISFKELRALVRSWKETMDVNGDDITISLGEGEMEAELDGDEVKI